MEKKIHSTEACQLIPSRKVSDTVLALIRGPIDCYDDYAEFFDTVVKLNEDDRLVLNIASPGGNCDVGFALCDVVGACKAPVEVYVTYPSYSMGAILALCGDSLTLNPDTFLMFHDYSGGSRGKGQEVADHTENYRKIFKSRFDRICQPFISKAESQRMFKGEDLYIHWKDDSYGVPLEQRLNRHYK